MSDSICRFVPVAKQSNHIRAVHFVYETEIHTLRQPFFHSVYRLYLIEKGSGVCKIGAQQYLLTSGSLFFAFPGISCEIDASEDFTFYYISFLGADVPAMLSDLGVGMHAPVYTDLHALLPFWQSAITSVHERNIHLLTESVLLYTLSLLADSNAEKTAVRTEEQPFDAIIRYVDEHYRDRDLTLSALAQIFPYTEKYLSVLFKKHLQINFRTYLNNLRMQYATELIERGFRSVSEIASMCGYSDPLYFSKVFKKLHAISPTEYIRIREKLSEPQTD